MFTLGMACTLLVDGVATAATVTAANTDGTFDVVAFPVHKLPVGVEGVAAAALTAVALPVVTNG